MRIAFIGLGSMGSLMARRLADVEEIDLVLFDIDPARLAAVAALGETADSIAAAARGADAVFSVVPADRHAKVVTGELATVAHAGQVYVDFSTIGVKTIETIAGLLGERGAITVSAGMTQSIEGATNGTLRLFVGGPDRLPAVLGPAFEALTEEVRLVGGVGAAKALKLVNNMVVTVIDAAICEGLVLGERLGLDYEALTDALGEGGADSWPLRHHIVPHVLPDDLGEGFFSTRLLIKDMTLCMSFLEGFGLPAPLVGVATSFYRGTTAIGHGEDYHPIVVRWLERGANFPAPRQPPTTHREGAGTQAEVAAAITRAVVALQALVDVEALRVLGLTGVEKVAAAEHLEAGSAGNDTLRELVAGGAGAALTAASLVADLEPALALAAATAVPATLFEVGRHVAIGLAERHGAEANLWAAAVG